MIGQQEEYASLELAQEIESKGGGKAKNLVVLRPSGVEMMEVLSGGTHSQQLKSFVRKLCRVTNGSGKYSEVSNPEELSALDGAELAEIMVDMSRIGNDVEVFNGGDGISAPITYNLMRPLRLVKQGDDEAEDVVISQIQFQAGKMGDLSEFLDAEGARNEFIVFMRRFGTLLGTTLPMTDGIIAMLDVLDYLVIRKKIMGKFVMGQKRWKRLSTA
jgi:hypothetical protein